MRKVDLVLAKHPGNDKVYLFEAPRFSHIRKGDKLVVDTKMGEKEATAEHICECMYIGENGSDDNCYKALLIGMGAMEPLAKVKAVFKRKEIQYEEE